MKAEPVQEERFGELVWINPTLEAIRDEECLCLNCELFKPNLANDHCPIATDFFELCKKYNNAFPITWCKPFRKKRS
jgi:hypothetical protein